MRLLNHRLVHGEIVELTHNRSLRSRDILLFSRSPSRVCIYQLVVVMMAGAPSSGVPEQVPRVSPLEEFKSRGM